MVDRVNRSTFSQPRRTRGRDPSARPLTLDTVSSLFRRRGRRGLFGLVAVFHFSVTPFCFWVFFLSTLCALSFDSLQRQLLRPEPLACKELSIRRDSIRVKAVFESVCFKRLLCLLLFSNNQFITFFSFLLITLTP